MTPIKSEIRVFYALFGNIWRKNAEKACVITVNLLSFLLTFGVNYYYQYSANAIPIEHV